MANLALTLPLFCLFLIYSNSNGIVTLGQAAGQQATWCIAKPGAPIAKLQANINYVCNVLMNCSIIRPGGACFKPNEVPNHASVLMNLYYQKAGRNLWNCHFNNTGVTTVTDPSYGSCKYALY